MEPTRTIGAVLRASDTRTLPNANTHSRMAARAIPVERISRRRLRRSHARFRTAAVHAARNPTPHTPALILAAAAGAWAATAPSTGLLSPLADLASRTLERVKAADAGGARATFKDFEGLWSRGLFSLALLAVLHEGAETVILFIGIEAGIGYYLAFKIAGESIHALQAVILVLVLAEVVSTEARRYAGKRKGTS